MASSLLTNDKVSFVVAKPFVSRGKEYQVGDDFPQDEARSIEVFVRARFVIPVVDDVSDKPKSWHKEIRPKDEVLEKLMRDRVQLVMPEPYHEPDSDEVVNLDVLTHPETTPDPEETTDEPEPQQEAAVFDPTDHNVDEVNDYLATHPDDSERVLDVERSNRQRKGILGEE